MILDASMRLTYLESSLKVLSCTLDGFLGDEIPDDLSTDSFIEGVQGIIDSLAEYAGTGERRLDRKGGV